MKISLGAAQTTGTRGTIACLARLVAGSADVYIVKEPIRTVCFAYFLMKISCGAAQSAGTRSAIACFASLVAGSADVYISKEPCLACETGITHATSRTSSITVIEIN